MDDHEVDEDPCDFFAQEVADHVRVALFTADCDEVVERQVRVSRQYSEDNQRDDSRRDAERGDNLRQRKHATAHRAAEQSEHAPAETAVLDGGQVPR